MRVAGTVTVDLAALDPDGWTNPHAVERVNCPTCHTRTEGPSA